MQVTGYFLVVIANHRHVPRNVEARFLQGLIAANGHAVVLAEDGCGPFGQSEDFSCRIVAGAGRPIPVENQILIEGNIGGRQRAAIALERIVQPTVEAMQAEGCPYQGVLFAGLMIENGEAKLLEHNVRFGDPECQVLMMRLMSDIVPALLAAADGQLKNLDLRWFDEAAMVVVMAAKGYPGRYQKGSVIRGLSEAAADPEVTIFHAGTGRNDSGELVATGGRVLGVTARGKTIREARDRAYTAVGGIDWPEGFYRGDIGWRALED